MSAHASDLIDVSGFLHAETSKAILFSELNAEKDAVWLPKSQCEFVRERGNCVTVTMPEWLAKTKELI